MPEIRELCGEKCWGDGQGLWAVIHKASDCEQQHGKTQHDFLPSLPGLAASSLQRKNIQTY